MTQETQDTSAEMGEEGWNCVDACECMDCISRIVQRVDRKISKMDTTGLSPWALRIQNSWIFVWDNGSNGDAPYNKTFYDEERESYVDVTYNRGANSIHYLLTDANATVSFIQLNYLKDKEYEQLKKDWIGFSHQMIAEKKSIHFGKGYNLRLFIQRIGKSCSFVLEKVRANTDI